MRAQMAAYLAERDQVLVDLIVECGPIKADPSEHISLVRVARGEADGICLFPFPARMNPPRSSDVLGRYLIGPCAAFTAAELGERGLLPEAVTERADGEGASAPR